MVQIRLGWRPLLLLLPLLVAGGFAPARADAPVTVEMRTQTTGGRFRFEPALIRVPPGTMVRFKADSHIHGVRAIPGMVPEGAAVFASGMGAPLEVRFEVPGVYGIKCAAHYALGMVGLVVVGEPPPDQLARARSVRHPPAAAAMFARLFRALSCLRGAPGCVPEVSVVDLGSGRLADQAER